MNKQKSKILAVLTFAFVFVIALSAFTCAGCSFGNNKRDAGLYDASGKLAYSWEKLIEEDFFKITTTGAEKSLSKGDNENRTTALSGELVIAKEITEIVKFVCRDCTGLTSVAIPENVTSIGQGAFQGCTSLTSVNIPKKVTTLGSSVFRNCTSLTSITIPDSVTDIGTYVFQGCTSLASVTIGSGLEIIHTSMFEGCTSLASITIPANIKRININAFKDCENLTKVYFANSVGWQVGGKPVDSTLVGNAGKAATMLTNDNVGDAWQLSE